jgi:homospermidine synthase
VQGDGLSAKLSVNKHRKGWEQADDKLLCKAGQEVDHRDHLLSQWATPKTKLPHKTKKQTANHHNTWTGRGLMEHWTCPWEKGWGKEINPQCGNPSKETQQKVTSKAGQVVDYRDDLLNLTCTQNWTAPPHLVSCWPSSCSWREHSYQMGKSRAVTTLLDLANLPHLTNKFNW